MNYLIYFDESNKLDQTEKTFSYYGAYGGTDKSLASTVKKVREIYKKNNSFSEMHFAEYSKDTNVKKYFQALTTVIREPIRINILVVNNRDAFASAANIGVSALELRNLFYIKIPERLFYGLTRDLPILHEPAAHDIVNVKIKIDSNDEYDILELNKKLVEQMNAHSAYRNKNYRIVKALSQDSEKSIPLQIIDTFMGIVVFLLEESYKENTDVTMIKSDLIYRFLMESDNLERFQKQIRLYEWTGREELMPISISEYLSLFMVHKTRFDVQEMLKIKNLMQQKPSIKTKELRELMGYPNSMLKQFLGYKDEIEGKGRNSFFFKDFI